MLTPHFFIFTLFWISSFRHHSFAYKSFKLYKKGDGRIV